MKFLSTFVLSATLALAGTAMTTAPAFAAKGNKAKAATSDCKMTTSADSRNGVQLVDKKGKFCKG